MSGTKKEKANSVSTAVPPAKTRMPRNPASADAQVASLERRLSGGTFATIATVAAKAGTGSVSYTDATVTVNNTYDYQVRAVNLGGGSVYSNIASAIVSLPAAPTSLNVIASLNGTTDQAVLTWLDNSNNETSFQVQRATNLAFTRLLINYTLLPPNTITQTQTGLARHITYYFRVRSVNGLGASAWSNVFIITTP